VTKIYKIQGGNLVMRFKKIIAFTMAATMVLGSTVTAFATDTTIAADSTTASEATGAGTNAYYDKNVMKVVVPTLSGAFDYKVDPEGAVASAKKYDGVEVTSVTDTTGLVFKNKDGEKYKVTNASDPFTITNKSAIPVNVSIEYMADATGKDITTVASKKDFSGTNDGPIYLEMSLTNDATQVFKTSATTIQTTLLSGFDGYEVSNASGSTYTFAAKDGYTAWPTSSFVITGAINKDLALAEWFNAPSGEATTRTAKSVPKISVKYSFTKVADALELSAVFGGDVLYVYKTSDGFTTGGGFGDAITSMTINGKTVASPSGLLKSAGTDFTTKYIEVPFATIAPLFGVAAGDIASLTAAEKQTILGYVKAIQVTADSKTYYGEVQ
jgi:hypothetical protein